jgi:DNA-binding beta-propeller fold protein YncE
MASSGVRRISGWFQVLLGIRQLVVGRWRWWVAVLVLVGIAVGGCGASRGRSTSIADQPAFRHVSGPPFGVAVTRDGRYAFVDLVSGRVLVYSLAHGAPALVRTIVVPGEAVGCSLSPAGRLLLVADGQGAAVVSIARAERGAAHPVLGILRPPGALHLRATGAIETTTSADGRFVFVSLEYGIPGGAIAVYDLGNDRRPRFGAADYVDSITLGPSVVGSALSTNGKDLYVTSEMAGRSQAVTRPDTGTLRGDGTLSVIDVNRAEHGSAHSVVATVPAGRQPVRVAVSPSGSILWVASRGSNSVLALSARQLLNNPAKALVATVKVGTAPVGLAVFDHGDRILVADSNRFDARGAHSSLTLLNARAALAHKPAVTATLRAGLFPREIAIDQHHNTALVTNFASNQLESVPLAGVG